MELTTSEMPVGIIPSQSHHANSSQCHIPKYIFAKDRNLITSHPQPQGFNKKKSDKIFILFYFLLFLIPQFWMGVWVEVIKEKVFINIITL